MAESTYRAKHDLETARNYLLQALGDLNHEKRGNNLGYIMSIEVGVQNLLYETNKIIQLL